VDSNGGHICMTGPISVIGWYTDQDPLHCNFHWRESSCVLTIQCFFLLHNQLQQKQIDGPDLICIALFFLKKKIIKKLAFFIG
jgi:hypothetical protein